VTAEVFHSATCFDISQGFIIVGDLPRSHASVVSSRGLCNTLCTQL